MIEYDPGVYKFRNLSCNLYLQASQVGMHLMVLGAKQADGAFGMTKSSLKLSHLGNSLIYMNKEEESSVVVGEGPSNSGNCMRLLLEVLKLRVLKKNRRLPKNKI
jgi:hypothetical protein